MRAASNTTWATVFGPSVSAGGKRCFISYVGDHDECQKCLDHFSGRHNWVAKENGTTLPVQSTGPAGPEAKPSDEDLDDDFDDFLLDQIDDKTLRRIFNGLVKNAKPIDQSV